MGAVLEHCTLLLHVLRPALVAFTSHSSTPTLMSALLNVSSLIQEEGFSPTSEISGGPRTMPVGLIWGHLVKGLSFLAMELEWEEKNDIKE